MTIGELSAKIGAGERTLAADVAILKKKWGRLLDLETSPSRGIRLHNHSIAVIGRIFIDLFRESTALQWMEQIFFYPGNGIDFYVKKLFVSRATLIRLLPKINLFLMERGMEIQRTNNQYVIVSKNEQYLRQFYAGFLIELYGADFGKLPVRCDTAILSAIIKLLIHQTINTTGTVSTYSNDIGIIYYMMLYLISLVRENQGYSAPSARSVDGEILPEHFLYLKQNFPNIETENLRSIHQLIVNHYDGWTSDEEKALIKREASACLNHIFQDMELPSDPVKFQYFCIVFERSYLTAKLRPFKTSALFDRIYYFSLTFKQNSLPVYLLLQENLNQFSKKIQFDLTGSLPDIIFWLCLFYPELSKFTPKKSALVISDFGLQHAEFLAEFISSFINRTHLNVAKISAVRLQDLEKTTHPQQYDLLISTIPDPPISHPHIYVIDDYPTKRDLFRIYEAIL
ncbi:MAG: helix-turn-helix domain-containing protein [Lawsonibacter sp.]